TLTLRRRPRGRLRRRSAPARHARERERGQRAPRAERHGWIWVSRPGTWSPPRGGDGFTGLAVGAAVALAVGAAVALTAGGADADAATDADADADADGADATGG